MAGQPPRKRAPAKKATPKVPAKKAASPRKPAAKKAPTKRTLAKKAAPASADARDRQVLELRHAGISLDVIAEQLKFADVRQAHDALVRALDATLPPTVDEAKRLELARLDRIQSMLWPKALRGDLAAFDRITRVMQERLRVVSTDPLPVTAERGPIEAATYDEVERLKSNAPALAAAALVLARVVDENRADPNATATAARELRITMSQLRGLAGTAPNGGRGEPPSPDSDKDKKPGTVTWLDELRQKAEKRASGSA